MKESIEDFYARSAGSSLFARLSTAEHAASSSLAKKSYDVVRSTVRNPT